MTEKDASILNDFLKNPAERHNVFDPIKINSLKTYKDLHGLSQNVCINPKLVALAKQMSDETGLTDKGYTYSFGTPDYYEKIKKLSLQEVKDSTEVKLKELEPLEKDNAGKKIYKIFNTALIKAKSRKTTRRINKNYDQLIKGTNAFYFHKAKTAMVPVLTSRNEGIFHELGHAINSTFRKNRKYVKSIPYLATSTILLSSIFLKKQNHADKEKSPVTKVREFVKNNIIPISLAISIPKLLEEGSASLRSLKFLKGKITSQQFKNIKGFSIAAWTGYAIKALSVALTLKFGVWISDQIQSAKQNPSNN